MTDDHHPDAALRDVSARYAAAVDNREEAGFLDVFQPDATLTVLRDGRTRTMHGHAEIAGVIERVAVYTRTYHLLGQSSYDVDDDTASGEVHCIAHHFTAADGAGDHATDRVLFIRYCDHYRRGGDGAWRIASRDVHVDWSETRTLAP